MPHHTATQTPVGMQQCIDQCLRCYQTCMTTADHCLEMGGRHADPAHMRTLIDCAAACRTSADFMMRGSELHVRTCATCAEACRICAESCEKLSDGDPVMHECAEQCRRCQESCEKMSH